MSDAQTGSSVMDTDRSLSQSVGHMHIPFSHLVRFLHLTPSHISEIEQKKYIYSFKVGKYSKDSRNSQYKAGVALIEMDIAVFCFKISI